MGYILFCVHFTTGLTCVQGTSISVCATQLSVCDVHIASDVCAVCMQHIHISYSLHTHTYPY